MKDALGDILECSGEETENLRKERRHLHPESRKELLLPFGGACDSVAARLVRGFEVRLTSITLLRASFLEPDLGLAHLWFQNDSHFLHLTIFANAKLGFGNLIGPRFVIIERAASLGGEETYVDEEMLAADVLEGYGDGVRILLQIGHAVEDLVGLGGFV